MQKSNKTIKQKLAQLDELVAWFEQDDVEVEQALEKFEIAQSLANDIAKQLKSAKNKVELIKKKFDA